MGKNKKKDRQANLIKQSWSEVDAIYQSIAESIVIVAANVNEAIRLLTLKGYENNNELIVTTNGLKRDLEQFTTDLLTIKARHSDKTGYTNTEDDFALSCSVFSDYHILSDRFRAIIFSPMLTITEYLAEAAYKEESTTTEDTTNE